MFFSVAVRYLPEIQPVSAIKLHPGANAGRGLKVIKSHLEHSHWAADAGYMWHLPLSPVYKHCMTRHKNLH